MRKWKWLFANGCETWSRARSEPGGTRWRTGGEVANGVSSQYSLATSERGLSSITQVDAHTSAASSRLNWLTHRFKWTRPFRGKTKSGFCACAITFRTSYTLCDCVTVLLRVTIYYWVWLCFYVLLCVTLLLYVTMCYCMWLCVAVFDRVLLCVSECYCVLLHVPVLLNVTICDCASPESLPNLSAGSHQTCHSTTSLLNRTEKF